MSNYLKTDRSYKLLGDCLKWMKRIESNSIPCVITDPPYGIKMMNKSWDTKVPSVEIWKECFRVMKEGAFAFVMSSSKASVLAEMIMNLKEAGFETHYPVMEWVYIQGMTKGHNLSKEADKNAGVERDIIGVYEHPRRKNRSYQTTSNMFSQDRKNDKLDNKLVVTIPKTDLAKRVDGLFGGYSPKPSKEMIIVVRKPRIKNYTNLEQFEYNGMGGTYLTRGSIPDFELEKALNSKGKTKLRDLIKKQIGGRLKHVYTFGETEETGFKARDKLDHIEINLNGFNSPDLLVSDNALGDHVSEKLSLDNWWWVKTKHIPKKIIDTFPFIYVPKPSKSEKNKGLKELEGKKVNDGRKTEIDNPYQRGETVRKNTHISVKPVKLMCYLIAISPTKKNDIILDPFGGSGTTAIGAKLSDRKYIIIEKDKESFEILKKRINAVKSQIKIKL